MEFREMQRQKGILSGKKRNQRRTNHKPKTNNGSTVVEPGEGEGESVYESKLNSVEKDFSLPDIPGDQIHFPVDTPNVRAAWAKWKEYRFKTHNKTYSMFGEQAALKQLEGMTEQQTTAAIFKAIESNWLNLYPDRNGKSNSTNKKGLDINAELQHIANHIKGGQ
jgi:hypothetical protein